MMHRFPEGRRRGEGAPEAAAARSPAVGGDGAGLLPPLGRHADELCVTELASVIWAVQMSTVEFHPWNSRRADTERPDEWRIDLDPMPECGFDTVRRVAHVAHEVLDELGAVGWPKTSGGSGLHVYVRIEPRWGFADVRRAALAFAREVERRARRRHHHVVAEGPRPAGRVRGLQPERARPHDRQRLLGARRARGDGVDADHLGRGRRRRAGRLHDRHGAPPVRRAGRPARRHRRHGLQPRHRCWSGPTGTSARERPTPAGRPTFRRASRVMPWPRWAGPELIARTGPFPG